MGKGQEAGHRNQLQVVGRREEGGHSLICYFESNVGRPAPFDSPWVDTLPHSTH